MDNTTLNNCSVEAIQQEIANLVDEIKELCVKRFKAENPKLDFNPTLDQLYFLASPKSQVNNISGMIIDILNDDISPEQKLQLLKERYDFAMESLK